MLRVLLGVNLLALLAALVKTPELAGWLSHYIEVAAAVEPCLLLSLGGLALLRNFLWHLPIRLGQGLIVLIVMVLAIVLYGFWQQLAWSDGVSVGRVALLAVMTTVLMLVYFDLRSRAFSPAQTEARLAALNARIRPHFLFNSLNAVLSLIRARPQQAEEALESLSDLFRAAMRDPGAMISLADEIALAEQYLALEKLRLGDRLQVTWEIGQVAMNLPIPPLMLQPLLENAVYHGIEPAAEGGVVRIVLDQKADELRVEISNPTIGQIQHAAGNQMAVANIRERLALYYDLEARLEIEASEQLYKVRIHLPCRQKQP